MKKRKIHRENVKQLVNLLVNNKRALVNRIHNDKPKGEELISVISKLTDIESGVETLTDMLEEDVKPHKTPKFGLL